MGGTILKAIRGAEFAEELGSPYGRRASGAGISGDILGRLKYALVLEILTWFVGLGEIKAGGELPERLAALAGALSRLRFAGGAHGGAALAEFERLLAALARAADLGDSARAARLLEVLPGRYVGTAERILARVDLPEGAGFDTLLAALAGEPELQHTAGRLADALTIAGRLEARAGGELGENLAAGLAHLLDASPLGRADSIRLIDEIPAAHLDEFMHALTFVGPEHLGRWDLAMLLNIARRPAAASILREGGGMVKATLCRGGDWGGFERLARGLELRRDQISDPQRYQRLLERLRAGDAGAFNELDDAASAFAEAQHTLRHGIATARGREAAYGLSRLAEGNRPSLLEALRVVENVDGVAVKEARAEELARLSDRELDGLDAIAALVYRPGAAGEVGTRAGRSPWDWESFLDALPSDYRQTVLEAVGEIAPHVDDGLERALHRVLYDRHVHGGPGQLLAARTLVRRHGATRLSLERMTHRQVGSRTVWREFDIDAEIGGRRVHVEVKTNLPRSGGRPAEASMAVGQIRKDLIDHAPAGYADLLYLYHPGVRGQLRDLGQDMLRLFGDATSPPDPGLLRGLNAKGVSLADAHLAFERWLQNNGLTVYDL